MAKQAGAKKAPASKITEEERLRMIAEAAYHRALERGFAPGDPNEDWLAAEAEIDAKLKGNHTKAAKATSAETKAKETGTKAKPKSAQPKPKSAAPKAKAGKK